MTMASPFSILKIRRLPGRITSEQTAVLLGFQPHDIQTLTRARLLKSLGALVPNAPKYFAACEIEALAADADWLHKATRAVSRHWKVKNAARLPNPTATLTESKPEH
jgi:hypothetical protein